MRILLTFLVAALAVGCSIPQAPPPEFQSYIQYMQTNLPRAEAGEKKWSEYYHEAMSKAQAANAPAYEMRMWADSIKNAAALESGSMTMEQFQAKRTVIRAENVAAGAEYRQQAAADYRRQQDASAAKWRAFSNGLAAGANAYNAGYNSVQPYQPQTIIVQQPVQAQPAYVPPPVYPRQRAPVQMPQPVYQPAPALTGFQPPVYVPPPQPPGNAYVTGFIQSESTNGSMKYCKYSNGAILTVASHQLCPQTTTK